MDYLKLVLIIDLFAIILLFKSSLPLPLLLIVFVVLLKGMVRAVHTKRPMFDYKRLSLQGTEWVLEKSNGHSERFDDLFLRFDAGFFCLIALKSPRLKILIPIFKDQLTPAQNRLLRLSVLSRIQDKV